MRKKLTPFLLSAALIIGCFAQSIITNSPVAFAEEETLQTTSPYTDITYTHSEAFAGLNIYNGIDVSKYNTSVDWAKVKADGIDFVFIRLGYRGYGSSGKLCADTSFESHITGALEAGLEVGVYYFTQALNTTEAEEEAAYCIEKLKDYNITLPVVLDYEFPNTGNGYKGGRMYDAGLSKSAATKNCKAFCNAIQEAGYTPMIYANKNDLTNTINGTSLGKTYKIWLANYNAKSTYTSTYEYWQYTENGTVDGVEGIVDCNFWYTDTTLGEAEATPTPSPTATPLPIEKVDISAVTIEPLSPVTYTGTEIMPLPKLTYNDRELTLDADYILNYQNNIEIGKATMTIIGLAGFTGTKNIKFNIRPPMVTSVQTISEAQSISLSWDQNEYATGYQVWRKSTYGSETYEKVKSYKYNTKITWNNKKLEADHEYYYRIRAYTTVGTKKYFSDYVYLTAATLPSGNHAVVNKKTKLYALPDLSGKRIVAIPKKSQITYLGRTFIDDKTQVYHISYTKDEKTYTGYAPITTKITF